MIYFDNASTTLPITSPSILYNPSSPHALGLTAERALRNARCAIDSMFNCSNSEIIFTSGGTESNNHGILGYTLAHMKRSVSLISSPYEHPSILAPIKFAADRGWASSYKTICPHNSDNEYKIPEGNVLISISHVNHETGDIHDISAISSLMKKQNPTAVIHVDGVQGFCKEHICIDGIDMYTFSGHKCHGPTGTGGLWIKKGITLTPLLHGGGQEFNKRSGTENVSAITQMAESVEILHKNKDVNHAHVSAIKEIIISLKNALPDVFVNKLTNHVSPYILNISFLGVKGEVLVHALSEKGIYVSMGAACRSRKNAKPALLLMGFTPEIAESAIRFSFSHLNTIEEANLARDIIIEQVKRLRGVLGKRR